MPAIGLVVLGLPPAWSSLLKGIFEVIRTEQTGWRYSTLAAIPQIAMDRMFSEDILEPGSFVITMELVPGEQSMGHSEPINAYSISSYENKGIQVLL